MQYLNAPVSMSATESKPRHRFMGQILLAAGGFLIGGQLLQMHQDDVEIARKEQQTIQQLQQIAALKNNTKSNDGPIGVRPAHRPSRGQLTPSSAP